MNNQEQLVIEIQDVLASEADPTQETLNRLLNDYVEAVNNCNRRLRKCDELLRKGYREEAIHQCEIEPKLLEEVACLDFPEREDWVYFVRNFELPGPPDLNHQEQLVIEIQDVLASEADPTQETLNRLLNDYVEAVNNCNRRLRKCDELLRKGYREEAIHQCEIEPKLLEEVACLDFPEREDWVYFVRNFELPGPPDLLVDIASDLNGAYADGQPLAQWMRRHRRHALAGSPLSVRLAIMRKIRELDADNPIWEDDIRTFERARHDELRADVEAAVGRADVGALATLEREIRSDDWLEAPTTSMVRQTSVLHAEVRVKLTIGCGVYYEIRNKKVYLVRSPGPPGQ